jgi:glycosyltransferase involved in cell wall biosynthesis
MLLSVIIPVYNERNTILKILEKVKSVKIDKIDKEIIIVDDFSTDGTREILESLKGKDEKLKIIFQKKHVGKGFAIRTALKFVEGEIVLIQDADLEYDPNEYPKLIEPILEGKAKVVYGSRVLKKNPKASIIFYIGGRFLSFLTNLLYGTNITDEPTGYKVFSTDVLKSIDLKCLGFEFCPEVTAKVAKKGYKIYEVPINYNPRSIKEGKKIRFKDALKAVFTLIKYRFID